MGKLLGLDFGEKRLGVALTDEEKKYAFAENTLEYKDEAVLRQTIKDLVEKEGVEKIILGLPLNFAGQKTSQTAKVEAFAAILKNLIRLPIEYQDERLTSKLSLSLFKEKNKRKTLCVTNWDG